MGAWGPGNLDNDSALDWVERFREKGADAGTEAFNAAGTDDYLDADEGSEALAAAEIVAAAFEKPSPAAGSDLIDLVTQHAAAIRALPDIRQKALAAVDRVLQDPSELRELWHEDGEDYAKQWRDAVDDLKMRLN